MMLNDDTFRFASTTEDPMEPDIVVYASDGNGSGDAMYVSADFTWSNAAFMGQMFNGGYVVSQDVPSPVDAEGTIVITATPEQVKAAEDAFEDAGVLVYGGQAVAVIIGALD